MKRYCLDMSGLSNPWQELPMDIHETLWQKIIVKVDEGIFATTKEVYESELVHITGELGACIKDNKAKLILEVGTGEWNWNGYIAHATRMNIDYRNYISEYIKASPKKTVCLNDMTVVALGKTLNLPVFSNEKSTANSPYYRRIPDICKLDSIDHHDFNSFLRAEGIKV